MAINNPGLTETGEYIQFDVTLSIRIADPEEVKAAVKKIFLSRFPRKADEFMVIDRAFTDVIRMYRGEYPGYFGCDTDYHDLRHILDVTLAMMRLLDGYEKTHGGTDESLGIERIQIGMITALFHDIGYIRHRNDSKHAHGAEYTRTHVSRGARFLTRYLPSIGKPQWVRRTTQLIHYTGYEKTVHLPDKLDHMLGCLLGTADLIAQMSDRAYLERCRDCLYTEFAIGRVPAPSNPDRPFESPTALLNQTPDFMRATVSKRLQGLFGSVYRYAEQHFNGDNLYMKGLERNCQYLEKLLEEESLHRLTRNIR